MRLRTARVGMALLALGLLLSGCFLFQPQVEVDFDASAVEGGQPLVVSFAPVTEETPVSYAWDFGDGAMSNEADPVHVYKAAGTFSVSLTVELADGRVGTETKTDYVTVSVRVMKSSSPAVYWINDRGVLKSGGRAGIGETVIADRFFSVAGMEIVNNKLYWLDHSQQSVYRADLDGMNKETIVHSRELYYLPWDLAVDSAAGKVYWVTLPHDTAVEAGDYDWVWIGGIHRANLDGSNVETLVTYPDGASEYATHIAVDRVLGRVYWSLQGESSWKLQYSPTGSWIPQTVAGNLPGSVRALSLDTLPTVGARYAYYVASGKVQRLHVAVGAPLEVLTGVGNYPSDIAVDALEGKLYVATENGIVRANVNGSEMEIIFSTDDVDALALY